MCKNVLTIVCWFCSLGWCLGADPEMGELLRHLKQKNPQGQSDAASILQRQRKDLISGLLSIVDNGDLQRSNSYAVVRAIDLLGEHRASEAVPSLVKLLLFQRVTEGGMPIEVGRGGGGLRVEPTPAVRALIRIGCPSIPLMLETIQQDNGDPATSSALTVLLGVKGDEEVMRLLRKAQAESKTPQAKSNLEGAIDYYEKNKKSIAATVKAASN
jgi:hypothetical protein